MNMEQWLSLATSEIRFPPDQEAVRRELADHLEDKKAVYLEQGRTLMEAETAVTEDMGDPEELAKELGRIHRPWWGYIWWASRVLLCLAIMIAVTELWVDINWSYFSQFSRPELPEGDIYIDIYGQEQTVLERWRPTGAKKLGAYRFTSPVVWLETNSTRGQGQTWCQLMVCLRADTWRFWEPCSPAQHMVLQNVALDSQGVEYARWEIRQEYKYISNILFCDTWRDLFTTWYLVYFYLPEPEAVPEWVDIPMGYGGASVRVDLEREEVS